MSIIDDITASLNRGASVTAKTASIIKLKAQIADVNSQRKNLCTGLGDALYERTKDISAITTGLEDFYAGIANCDERIAALEAQVKEVEARGPDVSSNGASWMRTCPNCGYGMNAKDSFCSRCGMPLNGDQGWQQSNGAPSPQKPDDSVNSARQEAPQQPTADNAPIDVEPC